MAPHDAQRGKAHHGCVEIHRSLSLVPLGGFLARQGVAAGKGHAMSAIADKITEVCMFFLLIAAMWAMEE